MLHLVKFLSLIFSYVFNSLIQNACGISSKRGKTSTPKYYSSAQTYKYGRSYVSICIRIIAMCKEQILKIVEDINFLNTQLSHYKI